MAIATDPKGRKPGFTMEETNSETGEEGLYRHPDNGTELVALSDPLYGNAQAEGAIRVGFKRVGDVPEGYVKTLVTASIDKENQAQKTATLSQDDLKGLHARLNALEGENARLREEKAKGGNLGTEVPGAEDTKLAAAHNVVTGRADGSAPTDASGVNAQEDSTGEAGSTDGDTEEEKPLAEQNRSELNATAATEGLENPESYNTKAELVEAIEAKRADSGDGEEGNE
jgi:hypothetical protein